MNTRFNYVRPKKRDSSNDDVFYKWTYEKRIKPISMNKDGSVADYVEQNFWKKEKCSWSDFVKSYDLGTVQDQVINHIEKGTPLITTHTLPAGDYTKLEKGAQIKREMAEKGITMEMLVSAVKDAMATSTVNKLEEKVEGVLNEK